ncbi:hypothetical protein PINS_up022481 [Pythium insidiosum]|nr:hypothetical protein PINS_up022481 [Pythium insidiosum]
MDERTLAHASLRRLQHVDRSSDASQSWALWLSSDQQRVLQLAVLLTCSASLISLVFVILHFFWERCAIFARWRHLLPHVQTSSSSRGFNARLVFVLAWIDLVTILARMTGRAVLHDEELCHVQAIALQVGSLASCLWMTCISFNLYRWVVMSESDKKRRSRFPIYVLITVFLPTMTAIYLVHGHRLGNATFYCWIMEPQFMFLHFYLYFAVLSVINVSLLLLVWVNMRRRMGRQQRHGGHGEYQGDSFTVVVIQRKALLYALVYLVHRVPIFIYRGTWS